jgi:hypothetical protein
MKDTERSGQALIIDLSQALASIRTAQGELNALMEPGATPAEIASRIKLCNILLWEISGVRRRLAMDLTFSPSRSLRLCARHVRH